MTGDGRRTLAAILTRAAQSPTVVLVMVLLLTVAVHIPGLTVWFHSDDFWYLSAVRYASTTTFVREAFNFRNTSEPVPGFLNHYRPLYLILWLVRYRLFGLDALAYQVTSLTLHLAVIVLTWWIARMISGRASTAHLAALVMALHPAFTRSVVWISAGTDLEVTFGTLLTLALFLAYVDGRRRAPRLYAASIAAYGIALCLHPKAIPLVAVLAGLCCLRSDRGLRELLRPATLACLAPFALMAGAYAAIQVYVQQSDPSLTRIYGFGSNSPRDLLGGFAIVAVPLWRNVWNPGNYLTVPAHRGVLWLGAVVMAAVGVGLVTVVRLRHRDAGVALLAALWFAAMVAPLTSFKLGVVDRDLYVAGPAWALLVGLAGSWIADATRLRPVVLRPLASTLLAVAIVLAGVWTVRYEWDFRGEANDYEAFTDQLHEAYPALPSGTRLYVVGGPPGLVRLYLPFVIATYYPGVQAESITADVAARRERTLAADERLFRFRE